VITGSVTVLASQAGALIGMALLEGSDIAIRAIPDGPVRIESISPP